MSDAVRISGEVSLEALIPYLMRPCTTVVSVAIDDRISYEVTYRSSPLSGGSASPPTLIEREISLRKGNAEGSNASGAPVVRDTYVLKYADEPKAQQTLVEQANWIVKLPHEIASHFPRMRSERDLTSGVANYYTMDFVPLPTLWSRVERGLGADQAIELLRPVLDFVYGPLLLNGAQEISNDVDYTRMRHIRRVQKRIAEVSGTHLDDLLEGGELKLNGVRLKSALEQLTALETCEDWARRLEPSSLFRIHGDLHLDNILVDVMDPSLFVLLDPRGYDAGSLDYDQGKLLHSVEGFYHVWHKGSEFALVEDETNREYSLLVNDRSLVERCRAMRDSLISALSLYPIMRNDSDWLLKARFAEACHFLSLGRFHLHNRGGVRAMILTGLYLLNSVVAELDSGHEVMPDYLDVLVPEA